MGLLPTAKPTGNEAPLANETGGAGVAPEAAMDEEPNVSPEEQEQYNQFMEKAADLIYTDDHEVEPTILEALRVPPETEGPEGGSPPIMALANSAFQIVKKLDSSASEQGISISDDVLAHAGQEIVEEIGEVARAANIYDYDEDELTGAYLQAIDLFRDYAIASGRTSKETLVAQFGEIEEADKAGKLGDIMPGMGGETMGEPPVQAPPQQ